MSVVLKIDGLELESVPVSVETYNEKEFTFYYRRKNKFFFRNAFNKISFVYENPSVLKNLKIGEKYELEIETVKTDL